MDGYEFPHSFLGREDKNLKQKMQSPESLRGILNWLVQGSIAWYASPHGLPMPDVIRNQVAKVRKDFDHVGQWLEECCDCESPDAWTSNGDVWQSYENWTKRLGIKSLFFSMVHLARNLSAKGFETGEFGYTQVGATRQKTRGVKGITVIVR